MIGKNAAYKIIILFLRINVYDFLRIGKDIYTAFYKMKMVKYVSIFRVKIFAIWS